MPNLAKLIEHGILCGNLATLQPVLSPMLWTSIATETPVQARHPRLFRAGPGQRRHPAGDQPVPQNQGDLEHPRQSGLNTITIGWWPSNPVEELSKGVMVSNDYQTAHDSNPKQWPLKPGTIHPARLEKSRPNSVSIPQN